VKLVTSPAKKKECRLATPGRKIALVQRRDGSVRHLLKGKKIVEKTRKAPHDTKQERPKKTAPDVHGVGVKKMEEAVREKH